LHIAAKYGYTKMVTYLISKKFPVEVRSKKELTPLHYAARAGHLSAVRLLIRKFDANIDAVNKVSIVSSF
jgi:ankyrin repeat protein